MVAPLPVGVKVTKEHRLLNFTLCRALPARMLSIRSALALLTTGRLADGLFDWEGGGGGGGPPLLTAGGGGGAGTLTGGGGGGAGTLPPPCLDGGGGGAERDGGGGA